MSVVSIYFVKTELELLSAEIIVRSFEIDSYNILACQRSISQKSKTLFDKVNPFLNRKTKGVFSTFREIESNLAAITNSIKEYDPKPRQIRIHLPRISTSKSNFSINFLKRAFPSSEIIICIIPHGLISIDIIPLTLSKRLKFLKRSWSFSRLLFPKLRYYVPHTDLIGALDDNVKYIYTFKGMENNYPAAKVKLLEIESKPRVEQEKKIAVVVGQPLLKDGFADQKNVALITQKIHSWLEENDFDIIYYSKHPRADGYLDFHCDDYLILKQEGAIEPLLCEMQPDAIVSCYSTALAIGKSLLGDKVKCISIGLELTNTDKKSELRQHFKRACIEVM